MTHTLTSTPRRSACCCARFSLPPGAFTTTGMLTTARWPSSAGPRCCSLLRGSTATEQSAGSTTLGAVEKHAAHRGARTLDPDVELAHRSNSAYEQSAPELCQNLD